METRKGSRSEWKKQHQYQQKYPNQQKYMNKYRKWSQHASHKRRAHVMRSEGRSVTTRETAEESYG